MLDSRSRSIWLDLRLVPVALLVLALLVGAAANWWRMSDGDGPTAGAAIASTDSTDGSDTPQPRLTIDDAFDRTWRRSDGPVQQQRVQRTWMWGPTPNGDDRTEQYSEAPEGQRTVRYYDKSRMEVTDPGGDQQSPWYVTNGLLVVELVSGLIQVGDNEYEQCNPAQENVAGDAGPDNGPTYATLAGLRDEPATAPGTTITRRIDSSGIVTDDPTLASYGAVAAERVTVPGIDHTVAAPFWEFMNASGPIEQDGTLVEGLLFEHPLYATGYPITEPYWTTVRVGGTQRDVLLQCFERRCLTWTPDNPAGWQVESGNVGQHYERWRYGTGDHDHPPTAAEPTATAAPTQPTAVSTVVPTTTPATEPRLVEIGPGAVDSWMRSIVRDRDDRVWIVAMNNNNATAGTGPGELRVYRATNPGIPDGFEHVEAATIEATGSGTIQAADAALDGQNLLHVVWVDRGAAGQPLLYRVLDLATGGWLAAPVPLDATNLSGYGGLAAQGGVSIGIGFDGLPRVAYTVSGFQNHIRTQHLTTDGWSEPGDAVRVEGSWIWHPALALGPDGTWYLAAYDASNRTILATSDDGDGWQPVDTVATSVLGPENIDQSPALLVTPDGIPTLTYLTGESYVRLSQYRDGRWQDVPINGDHHTHAPGLGVFADGTLIVAGHNEGSPPTALNAISGQPGSWGAWDALVDIQADGSEVFRWAGAFSSPSTDVIDLVFFDEDTNDDSTFDDQTLYYLAIPTP